MASRIALRSFALLYLSLLLLILVAMIFFKAFEDGFANAWETVTTPESLNAFKLTLITVGIAVPLNSAVFSEGVAPLAIRLKAFQRAA